MFTTVTRYVHFFGLTIPVYRKSVYVRSYAIEQGFPTGVALDAHVAWLNAR